MNTNALAFLAASDGPISTFCKNTLVHTPAAQAAGLARAILALAEGEELERGPWTVYRMDEETWKAHLTGTHPDDTGEFLDGADDVRAWAAEVAS